MSPTGKSPDAYDERLSRLYTRCGGKRDQYDEWAAQYDADLVDDLDYVAHLEATGLFSRVVPDRAARILDVACGTGLVGAELRRLGYQHLDGSDFSANMLDQAGHRQVYGRTFQHDVSRALDPEPGYDAVISVGLFAFGVPGIECLANVVHCAKPGGRAVITVNGAAWEALDLGEVVDSVIARHDLVLEEVVDIDYIRKENIRARALVVSR